MQGLKVFYGYSHKDAELLAKLQNWLSTLRTETVISEWYDGKVLAGQDFTAEIQAHLSEADLVLLLLSQDFIASEACMAEMSFAIKTKGKSRTIPIILKTCAWKDTDCKQLLALPKDAKPIFSWASQDEAWLDAFTGIKQAVKDLLQSFTIKKPFYDEIQAVEFVRQKKRHITLDDIFTFPTLTIDRNSESGEVFQHVQYEYVSAPENKAILIVGEELSGKTSLLRQVFTRIQPDYSTVLLDGTRIYKSVNYEEILQKEFSQQITGSFDEWLKIKNKAVLIDDFHHRMKRQIFSYLSRTFSKVIISMNLDEYLVYFKDDASLASFSTLTLRPLTLARQEQLVRKWLTLRDHDVPTEAEDLATDKAEAKLNSIIASNQIIPRYPFYVLSILQTLESFMPKDYSITAYGHCYHALVHAQLVRKGLDGEAIDTCFTFLTELAADMQAVLRKTDQYAAQEYVSFKEQYQHRHYIQASILGRLEAKEYPIIHLNGERYRFEHPYLYYYFLGKHLATNGTETEINYLCQNIHLKENAYIIIFAVHHSEKKEIVESILLHCMCSFDKVSPATLDATETKFMAELMLKLPKSIISNKSVSENRKDQREAPQDQDDFAEHQEKDSGLLEISRGLKIIEVLGQILKNRAGSFEKPAVLDILQNTIDLGLRILNMFLNDFRQPEFLIWLRSRLEEAENESLSTRKQKIR